MFPSVPGVYDVLYAWLIDLDLILHYMYLQCMAITESFVGRSEALHNN